MDHPANRYLLKVLLWTVALQLGTISALGQLPTSYRLPVNRMPEPAVGSNLPLQRIGPNDLIAVSVYGAPELSRAVRVNAEGYIRLPMMRTPIRAAGLMPAELEEAIAEALKKEELLVDPYVTVTVVEYQSRPISVAGAVRNPITFQAIGRVTLLEALTRAGGLREDAGPEILVTKQIVDSNGKATLMTQRVPVKKLIDEADPEYNLILEGGEEIRVPEGSKIYVVGNVKRPGAFPVDENGQSSVLKALALAEGLAQYADDKAYIYRLDDRTGTKKEIEIELKKILQRQAPDVTLVANDILYVPDNSGKRAKMTALEKALTFGLTVGAWGIIYGLIR